MSQNDFAMSWIEAVLTYYVYVMKDMYVLVKAEDKYHFLPNWIKFVVGKCNDIYFPTRNIIQRNKI